MTDNVVSLGLPTTEDVAPEKVLRGALEAGLTEVVVVGYDKDGKEYIASSEANGCYILWLLELGRFRLMSLAPASMPPIPEKEGAVLAFPSGQPEPKEPA
jgi:hypothetical protein